MNGGPKALAELIADWRGDAAVLRRRGDEKQAKVLEECADQAAEAAAEFMTPLSEHDALVRSGWPKHKLRWWFGKWKRDGYAWEDGDQRFYVACVVPPRTRTIGPRESGEEAGARTARRRSA